MKILLRLTLMALVALALTGCGVSKELYQEQYNQARDLEAKNKDLMHRLGEKTTEAEGLATDLKVSNAELARSTGEGERLTLALEEVNGRLDTCQKARESLSGELDLTKKTLRSGEGEIADLMKMMDAKEKGWAAEREGLEAGHAKALGERDGEIEALRGHLSTVEAENTVLREEKEKLAREKQEKIEEMSSTYEGLLNTMEQEIKAGRVTISRLKGQLTVNMVDEILFPSGSASVKTEGKEVLLRVAEALASATDQAIVIEGHTDNVPIRGALTEIFATNWELSTARAVSVVRYLEQKGGVDAARLSAVGYGEYRPIADNETKEGRAKNRRIEIKLVPMPAAPAAEDEAGEGMNQPAQGEVTPADRGEAAPEASAPPAAAEPAQ